MINIMMMSNRKEKGGEKFFLLKLPIGINTK